MEALSEKGINIKENWKNALGNAVLKGKNYNTVSSMRSNKIRRNSDAKLINFCIF